MYLQCKYNLPNAPPTAPAPVSPCSERLGSRGSPAARGSVIAAGRPARDARPEFERSSVSIHSGSRQACSLRNAETALRKTNA
jgi:hypothetical protein